MAQRSSLRNSCEIAEIEEDELNLVEHYNGTHSPRSDQRTEGKDQRSLASNLARLSSLEDDLNQLFEIFNRRNSSQGMDHSPRNGVGPSRKNSSKKLDRASSSSAFGISDRVNLKQAFRGLCISQASDTAATKRSAKSGRSSKAGRKMTIYKNVVVEDDISVVSQHEGKGSLLEISFVPEESTPLSNGTRASSKQMEKARESYESRSEMPKMEVLSTERTLPASSSNADNSILKMVKDTLVQNGKAFVPPELVETSPDEMIHPPSAMPSPDADDNVLRTSESGPVENSMFSLSNDRASHVSLTEMSMKDEQTTLPFAHNHYDGKKREEMAKGISPWREVLPPSPNPGYLTSTLELMHKEDYPDAASLQQSDRISSVWDPSTNCATPYKSVNKGKTPSVKGGQKSSLQIVPSVGLAKGSNVKKQMKNVSRLVKPVIKTKNFVKRKSSKPTTLAHSPQDIHSEFNNALYPGSDHIVCPRCHCVLNDEWEDVEEDSLLSPGATPSAELSPLSPAVSPVAELSPLSPVASPVEMSPDNIFPDFGTPTYNVDSPGKVKEADEERKNFKSTDKGEFTQSSKSSPDECSSSTSISGESNPGRSSFCDRPHMSKDVRWLAIRQIRTQHGTVGLKHFNLLKKLGCGDIGTVYLAELIETSCLFAIKVMDNEFLIRRKKIVRAQTEREILRMLDHPFLPTLYSQFTTDNLSCLVMEYCPGGDLHVLRQKQPGRCFAEQAARFYVAEVLLALEYLHMLGVVYRDLKPENILVREDGHIMLSDFDLSLRCAVNPTLFVSPSTSETSKSMSGPLKTSGCVKKPSCHVSCFGPRVLRGPNKPRKLKPEPTNLLKPMPQLVAEPTMARSNSFVGTHEYLAPEIVKGEGHGSAVDWWTFGIFLYELLYGRTPFRGCGNEETLTNVVLHSLKFPESPLVSLQARDLMAALLVKEPEGRLGSERGAAEVKQHPFFEGLNWALIRCAVPPELPEFHRSYGVAKDSRGEQLEFEVF